MGIVESRVENVLNFLKRNIENVLNSQCNDQDIKTNIGCGGIYMDTQITIADVAKYAGVSTATAGRVVGGYGNVSEKSRERF